MIEEEFLATIKLITSEEILAIVAPLDNDKLIVTNPITVQQALSKTGFVIFKVLPWLKTTTSDTVIIDKRNIITVAECFDVEMIDLYQQYLKGKDFYSTGNERKLTKEEGYISNVQEAKKKLENLYRSSSSDTSSSDKTNT
jgi:hypothetical protein